MLPQNNYVDILNSLKEKIRKARYKAASAVNVELLKLYWEIGNTIVEQQKIEGWGAKIIDKLAIDLKIEFTDFKGLSVRNLKYMRAFAEAYPNFISSIVQPPVAQIQDNEKQSDEFVQVPLAQIENDSELEFVQGTLAQLSWYHHITLLDKIKDDQERKFYIQETVENGWSRDVMVHQIESGLYNRKGKISSNFKNTIAPDKSELVQQLFKDPYKFDFIHLGKEAKERDLEDALTNQLTKFLLELGQFFSFLGRQYKMMLGEKEYFYDLLFYHTRLKRYIIIELKIDEFKPEYKGKMEFYLNLADEYLKQDDDEGSIGLILCKTKDGLVAEYALRDSSKPIGISEYKISELLPENIRGEMPSIEELEAEIEKEYEELKSPSQKRFESLKEKISQIKSPEIKEKVSTPILNEIFDKSISPLFQTILSRMEEYSKLYVSSNYYWQGRSKIVNIDELAEDWKNEEFLKSHLDLSFSYFLTGFKKAGTDTFNNSFEMKFLINDYWYGFILNNTSPLLLKKLYHEQLTTQEIDLIADAICNYLIDDIENRIKTIKSE